MSLPKSLVTEIAASEGLCRALNCGAAKSRMKLKVNGSEEKAYFAAHLSNEHAVHFTGSCTWGVSGFTFDVWLAQDKSGVVEPKSKIVINNASCTASLAERERALVEFFKAIAKDLQKKKDREPGKSGGRTVPPVIQARNKSNKPFTTNQGNIDAWEAKGTFDSTFSDFLRGCEPEGLMCVGHPTSKSKAKAKSAAKSKKTRAKTTTKKVKAKASTKKKKK